MFYIRENQMIFESPLHSIGQAALEAFDRKVADARTALEATIVASLQRWDKLVEDFDQAQTPEHKAVAALAMLNELDALDVFQGCVGIKTAIGTMRVESVEDLRMGFHLHVGRQIDGEVAGLLWSAARLKQAYSDAFERMIAPWRLAALEREGL